MEEGINGGRNEWRMEGMEDGRDGGRNEWRKE